MKKVLKIAIVIMLFITIFILGKKLYFMGSQIKREKILTATIWELYEEGYTKDDIKSIKSFYNPISGGVLPYEVFVVFYNDKSKIHIYSWENANENKIIYSSEMSNTPISK